MKNPPRSGGFFFGSGITSLRDMSLHRNGPGGRCALAIGADAPPRYFFF
jgi:hypothetical protein